MAGYMNDRETARPRLRIIRNSAPDPQAIEVEAEPKKADAG